MMSLIDGMTAHMFRADPASGSVVFYPNGPCGHGYVLPDDAAVQRIRRFVRWMMIFALGVPILGMQVMIALLGQPMAWPASVWAAAGLALAVLTIGFQVGLRRMVSGLPKSETALTMAEALKAQTMGLPRWYFLAMAIVGPLLMVGSILWLLNAPSFMERVWALAGLTLFAITTIQAFAGLRMRPDEAPEPTGTHVAH